MHATELRQKRVYIHVRRKDEGKKNSVPLALSPKMPALDTTAPVLRETYAAYQKTMRERSLALLKQTLKEMSRSTDPDSIPHIKSMTNLIRRIENPCPCLATYAPCKKCDAVNLIELEMDIRPPVINF
jgi:hypothetical protein